MVYMMKDILQYLPFALVVGAVLLLMAVFALVTINYFRNEEKRLASFPMSKKKKSVSV